MTSKWDRVRGSFERAHDDLFEPNYTAEFFNYSQGTWDPDNDEITGETRESIGTENVEIVPPAIDSTVRTDGTSFSWDTSIRLPLEDLTDGDWGTNWGSNWGGSEIVPLGVDNERPTEVEITNDVENDTETYEVHGYKQELGSGMVMIRLIEQ